ncbi:MAG: molecular chaperone GrpE [Halothiobacillaceae bacterium]|nr:MAG: molecular chaperone GrpE [Halothiobacillaceae bacterium]
MAQQEDAVMHSNETEPTGNSEKAVTAEGTSQAPETGREEATSHAELMVTIEGLQAELDGYKERYLRLGAEMENIRRRATKDLESAHKFGLEKIAGELLPVRDSLELGLKAAEGTPSTKNLIPSSTRRWRCNPPTVLSPTRWLRSTRRVIY